MDLLNRLGHLQRIVKGFLQPHEFAEIWQAALVFVKENKTEALSVDRRILPFNQIVVTILATREQRDLWQPLLNSFNPTAEASSYLRDQKIEAARDFQVQVSFVDEAPSSWAPDALFNVETHNVVRETAGSRPTPPLRELRIEQGETGAPVYELGQSEICIGRCQTVQDRYGRIIRRNDIYFIDDQSEINSSVSQEHARIRGDRESGEFFLFDTSANGTHIFRSGRAIQVPPGENRGVRLQDGDEIYFGKAMARYHVRDSKPG